MLDYWCLGWLPGSLAFLHDKAAMNHVHAAGETKLPGFVRGELQRGTGEGWQCFAGLKIGKDHPGTAIARFLAVKY